MTKTEPWRGLVFTEVKGGPFFVQDLLMPGTGSTAGQSILAPQRDIPEFRGGTIAVAPLEGPFEGFGQASSPGKLEVGGQKPPLPARRTIEDYGLTVEDARRIRGELAAFADDWDSEE